MRSVADPGRSNSFRTIVDSFLNQPGLPFSEVLSAERVERVFARHGNLFGVGKVYSTVVTLWAFLGQVLRDGKQAACKSAVASIISYETRAGRAAPHENTGDYCRARAKLSEAALHDLTVEIAAELEERADPGWLWKGRNALLVHDDRAVDEPAGRR